MRGARQTGKTWLLKDFGKSQFKKMVYVNFEETPSLQSLFKNDFDIPRIITTLQIHSQINITPGDTLIVFDEIQCAERGITSLKYFNENAPQYFLIAAGSLLGMSLHDNVSFPVGKVQFIDLYPMSFTEFLSSVNEEGLSEIVRKKDWDIISVFHDKLLNYLKYYLYTGGMPEVVSVFSETRDWELVRTVQHQILQSYAGDFSKHIPTEVVPRINMVWQSIPSQLAKENKKFIYRLIREGARARDFETAIQWLTDCGLVLKSHRISKPKMPLIAYQDLSVFKLFLVDVGLLAAMTNIHIRTLIEGDAIFTEFKGALTEQYVMQQLQTVSNRYIGYWTNERSTSEVDFVIQDGSDITAIEVKSGTNLRSKSLRFFYDKYKPLRVVRTAPSPYKVQDWMINIPLYAI
jgi:hypothetical protein